ncbi:unnamed protein product [Plutella xylostella]|uniref:RNA-directed DNA polymerase n=1 Tax=Plutella xylostella TaxID=51655 RepID=A0A8S4E787_PLUXY|nr:unnamed protein product [Plutella xylostella]
MAFQVNISPFDHKCDDWTIFNGRLKQLFKVNKITESEQSAVLLTYLSEESFRLARNLAYPSELETLAYKDVVLLLDKHFAPSKPSYADKAKFYSATRSPGEKLNEWAARLRGLAANCNFLTALYTILLDRFVLGLGIGPERDKLFEQDPATLTLSKAIDLAEQAGGARLARSVGAGLSDMPLKEEALYYGSRGGQAGGSGEHRRHAARAPGRGDHAHAHGDVSGVSRCAVCGMKNHATEKCRFKSYKCQGCGLKGHLKKMCKNKVRLNNIADESVPTASDLSNSDSECEEYVDGLLNSFSALWEDELGKFNQFKVDLHMKEGSIPKFFKPRPLPFALKDKVESELKRLVDNGILIPLRYSKYGTPIVPVVKSNGEIRICGDFALTINNDLYIDKYPLPRIEEIFAILGGGQQYTKLDLKQAYSQLELSEDSQELTTISTTKGLYKYSRLVYGLANAPAIFQRTIESVLAGIDGVCVFIDDIAVTGPTRQIHLERLELVLKRLQEAGLKLKKNKCEFFQDSITYLGYVIDKYGLHKCPTKVQAVINAPKPKDVTEVKRFLGMVNYYRTFIPNASMVLSPLHELLRAGAAWEWGARQQQAFELAKRELASDRVLAHFDPEAQVLLSVDAGPEGLGAVLSQLCKDGVERPLAFGSRSLSSNERNYSQIQKEATAIIFGIKRFHQYLYGRQEPFILKTDHKPLLSIFGKKNGISVMAASRLQRYAVFLSAYNYTIQYISSENNSVADYFSRAPISGSEMKNKDEVSDLRFIQLFNVNVAPVTFSAIQKATESDSVLKTVCRYMKLGWPRKINCNLIRPYFHCKSELEIVQGCLLRGHRVVVPSEHRNQLLNELHKGHMGMVKTKALARAKMWWPGIDTDIEQLISACASCCALRPAPPRAPPAPWPRPAAPWERIHIDYMTVTQKNYLIVVDAYSKWVECILMDNSTSSNALIVKLKYLFTTFGLPKIIVSDNDVKINSDEFKAFCKNNGVEHVTSPIYHPCSNGLAENSVKTCKKMIKSIIINNIVNSKTLNEKLNDYLFEFRNTMHCTTGYTPAYLMFGRNLRTKLDLILPPNKVESSVSQEPNKHICKRSFNIGDLVWARWFINRKPRWCKGVIKDRLGNRMFSVYFIDFNECERRHIDQLIKRSNGELAPVTESPHSHQQLSYPTGTSFFPSGNRSETILEVENNSREEEGQPEHIVTSSAEPSVPDSGTSAAVTSPPAGAPAAVDNELAPTEPESYSSRLRPRNKILLEPWMEVSNKFFLVAAVTQIGILCWYADDLQSASVGVSDAVYESGWFRCNTECRRLLVNVIQRSQKPLYFTAMKFNNITMRTYASILTTAYSYFALLYSMYSKN